MRYAVLIATRNRYDLCLRAIASATGQTIPPELIVVVDDCSSDPRYGRIGGDGVEVIRLEQPSRAATGSGFAVGWVRNAGLDRLAGYDGWLAFLDDDDEWMPDRVAKQAAVIEMGAGVICGNAVNRDPAGQVLGLHHDFPGGREIAPGLRDVTHLTAFFNPVVNSTAIVRPDVAAAVGRQLPVGFGEDWDYWRRAGHVAPIHMVDDVVAYYTQGNPKEYTL